MNYFEPLPEPEVPFLPPSPKRVKTQSMGTGSDEPLQPKDFLSGNDQNSIQ